MAKELPSDEIQRLLKTVADHYDSEDRSVRERQIRQWKKLKYYWEGFQRIWWNEVAHDWRTYDANLAEGSSSSDSAYYDKQVNVFRAYLESIIAALSVTVPSIVCFPDDAENGLDLSTAKAGDKIGELIYKHNDVMLLWLHALYIFCTEGLICAYNYTKADEDYGTYKVNEYEDEEKEQQTPFCAVCGTQLGDPELTEDEEDEFDPDDDDVEVKDLIDDGKLLCPQCLEMVDPEYKKNKFIVTRIIGSKNEPKSRQCIEVYGGLYVKVANYAMKPQDTPYLIWAYEVDSSSVLDKYDHLWEKYSDGTKLQSASGSMSDGYEKWARLSTQYRGEYPTNTTTIKHCWLRPASFNALKEEDAKKLKKKYPDGAKVVFVNDIFCEACNEDLDDHWTLSQNPLSDYLHHDPLGNLLISVQDITNDLLSLVVQTIEHGIPQTFADPTVLNFDQYRQTEATPGGIFPAKPVAGKGIGDGFYEVKTATLSGEVLPFSEKIQEAGQIVSGALPSLFGGSSANDSKTAAQYAMSRAQALQRLNTTNKMLTTWWKNIFSKAIPAYIKDVAEDERIVQKDASNNFVNVFIRKAELQGKIGSVELEASDQLPITWSQQKDVIMQLMNMNNPEIMQALMDPVNLDMLQRIIGLTDFEIPGEDDRQKQYDEIQQLLSSEPLPNPAAMTGQMQPGQPPPDQFEPSVGIDPMLDNNAIHADICKSYLIGERGRQAKIDNPKGYQNVLLHMQQHVKVQQAMAAMAAQQQQPNQQQNQQQPNAAPKGPNHGNGIEPKQPSIN